MSVVIPARNAAAVLALQLAALSVQTTRLRFEVLVSDNGSTDGTAAVAQAFSRALPVRVIDASKRKGVNHARNQGILAAQAEIILLCDSDDQVAPNWIEEMAAKLASFDSVGGCYALWYPDRGETGQVECPAHLTQSDFLPYPIGANCGFRRTVWRELGGFDESYDQGGADEVEFFWRMQLQGFSFGVATDASITYRVPEQTWPRMRKAYRVRREGMRLARDYAPYGAPARLSPVRLLRGCVGVCVRSPTALRSRLGRNDWLLMAAKQAGLIAGYWRYR